MFGPIGNLERFRTVQFRWPVLESFDPFENGSAQERTVAFRWPVLEKVDPFQNRAANVRTVAFCRPFLDVVNSRVPICVRMGLPKCGPSFFRPVVKPAIRRYRAVSCDVTNHV